jgi:hypothetical protein
VLEANIKKSKFSKLSICHTEIGSFQKAEGNILNQFKTPVKNNNSNKVTTKVMPEITGATGTISKSLRQYLSKIPGEHEINP